MKKVITITVPEPCHENWDQMTPTEKGKFCGVCTKEVIDFSKSSDEELIKKIGKGEDLCGRFNASQLNRKLTLERKSKNNLLPYAASLLLPLGLLGGPDTVAQSGPNIAETHFTSLGIGSHSMDKSLVIITGFVTNKHGVPVSKAKITVEESDKSVFSNLDGSYRIVCTSGSTLVFTAPNMVVRKSKTGTAHAQLDIVFEAAIQSIMVDGMVGLVIEPEETIEGEIEIEEIPEIDQEEIDNLEEKTIAEQLITIPISCSLNNDVAVSETIFNEIDATKITISGTITDENNLPLPGVNVVFKDSNIGTQTDFNGNYKIHPKANQSLVFHFLGYETKEIRVSNVSNTIGFQMQPMVEGNVKVLIRGRAAVNIDQEELNAIKWKRSYSYISQKNEQERKERVEQRRKAKANEVAFQKIKLEKKKTAEAAKNRKRKRK